MSLLLEVLSYGDNAQWEGESAKAPLPVPSASDIEQIDRYRASNRVPHFSPGYEVYKLRLVLEICDSERLRIAFREGARLPEKFGSRFDERVIEYPWVFSRLPSAQDQTADLILDAGSTLNKKLFLESPILQHRHLIIYTLETDWINYNPMVSYLFGDLRSMILKDNIVDNLICISTLEHVGFTYDYENYSRHRPWPHAEPESYLTAVSEFRRVLKPGGRLYLTLPFGRFEVHGWLQQFDAAMIERVKSCFAGTVSSEVYYRYERDGWQLTLPEACADSSYFNIHETGKFEEDGLAAARAICCLELEKPDP